MLPNCSLNEVVESTKEVDIRDEHRTTGSQRDRTSGKGDAFNAARGVALGCAGGVMCWVFLGGLLYWLMV